MTSRIPAGPRDRDHAEELLLVALCAGHRCYALRHRHVPRHVADDPLVKVLRAAIRRQPKSVLVSASCLGACADGCLVVVGPSRATDHGQLSWVGTPAMITCAEVGDRAAALAEWIAGRDPDITTLPGELAATPSGPDLRRDRR